MQDRGGDGHSVRVGVNQDGRAARKALLTDRAHWASAGWLLAALLSLASLPVPLSTLQSPVMTGSSLGTAVTYTVTTLYPWGGTSTATGTATFEGVAPGGVNYVVPLLPSALVLTAAALIGFLPLTRRLAGPAERFASAAAPVAAGVVIAVSACELLSFRAFSSRYETGGVYGDVPNRPELFLGPSTWLVAAAALTALLTCIVLALRPAEGGPEPSPQTPVAMEHGEADPESSMSTVFPVPATTAPPRPFASTDPRPPRNPDDSDGPPLDLTLFRRPSDSGNKPS